MVPSALWMLSTLYLKLSNLYKIFQWDITLTASDATVLQCIFDTALDRYKCFIRILGISSIEPRKHFKVSCSPIWGIKLACWFRWSDKWNKKYKCRQFTAVQKHLCASWQSVDTSFDGFKTLLVGYRSRGPPTSRTWTWIRWPLRYYAIKAVRHHHQAMLWKVISICRFKLIHTTHRNSSNFDIRGSTA